MICTAAKLWPPIVGLIYLVNPICCHYCMQNLVKPENYSVLELPSRPTVVNVEYYLINMEDIVETRKQYNVHMWLNLSWTDPRLAGYYPLRENCSAMLVQLDKDNLKQIWLPSVDFRRTSYNLYTNADRIPVFLRKDGAVSIKMQVSTTFGCPMEFKR